MRHYKSAILLLLLFFIPLISGCVTEGVLKAKFSNLPQWTMGQRGGFPLTVEGGTPPYACAITNGALPQGFALTNCEIDGTPPLLAGGTTQSISPKFTVTITDSANPPNTLAVEMAIVVKQPSLTLVTNPVACTVGQYCSANLIANVTGGTPPYHYQSDTFRNGTPPWGTVVGVDGLLIGIPTREGTYTFGVCAVDAVALSVCEQVTAIIEPETEITYSGSFSMSGNLYKPIPDYSTTCTFADTFAGTITLHLTKGEAGAVSGTADVEGTFTSYGVAGSTAIYTCLDSQVPWSDSASVSGTTSALEFSASFITAGGSTCTGPFSGSVSEDSVSGTMEFTCDCCTGSASSSVTLAKE